MVSLMIITYHRRCLAMLKSPVMDEKMGAVLLQEPLPGKVLRLFRLPLFPLEQKSNALYLINQMVFLWGTVLTGRIAPAFCDAYELA